MPKFDLRDHDLGALLFFYLDNKKNNLFVGIINPFNGKFSLEEKNSEQTQDIQVRNLKQQVQAPSNWYAVAITKHRAEGQSHQCIRYIEPVPAEEEYTLDRITLMLRKEQYKKDIAQLALQIKQPPKVPPNQPISIFSNSKKRAHQNNLKESVQQDDSEESNLIDSVIKKLQFCPTFY